MGRPRVPEGPAPERAVQKLRVRYAKRGRLRFSSTRDFQRALERALRRADVPMAFSAGFHPHPKISYANAAPTGTASESEYFEISVTQRVDLDAVRTALDAALPEGIDILQVVEAAPGALADRLQASDWVLAFRDVELERLAEVAATFLAQERVEVTRTFKTGPRTFDVRSAVISLGAAMSDTVTDAAPQVVPSGAGRCAILRVVVRHTTPAVRPDDILTALRAVADLESLTPPLVTRLAQGPLQDATVRVADPLAADEKADGS